MISHPKISIVMPSFNQVEFIRSAIRSVLDQNYPNLEFIIIDGGSSDGSVDVIRQYADRLAYWVSEKDGGHGDALNKGFARSTGEIMAWLNSDDLYHPWTFRTVAEVFNDLPEVDWITGIPVKWDKDGRIIHTSHNYMLNKFDYCTGRYEWLQQESTFWRRSLWLKAGGHVDTHQKLAVDGELWTRFFMFSDIVHVECVLGGFREWGGNRSIAHSDQIHLEMRRAIAAMEPRLGHHDAKTLKEIRRVKAIPAQKLGFRMRSLGQKVMRKQHLAQDAAYLTAAYRNGTWIKGTAPFVV